MSVRVSLRELEQQLGALLDRVARDDEECVVQRNGKDYAVIIGIQRWRRRIAERQLDALGPSLQLDEAKQARTEDLLAARASRSLTVGERRDLAATHGRVGSATLSRMSRGLRDRFKPARTKAADPRTGQRVALFNPRMDAWNDHFQWTTDGIRIRGRTPVGRATVKALRLNRTFLLAARRVWARYHLHPPE